MANENPAWGEQRIANEFLVKLGIRLSPRTVSKYLSRRPPGRPRGNLRWSTFLRLHAQGIIACDFLVTVTATFRLLYVLVVIEHRSRRLIHATSPPIQVPPGRSNNFARPPGSKSGTNTCFTIAIVFLPNTSTSRSEGSESRC
jgi:hypothetical protein